MKQSLPHDFDDLREALAAHGVGLLVDVLGLPKLSCLGTGRNDDGDDVGLKPQARAQGWAHLLELGGQASSDELDKVLMFVLLDHRDDVVGNGVLLVRAVLVDVEVVD